MTADFIRPVGTPAPAPIIPSTPAATDAVATDLPPGKSVTAPDAGTNVRNNMQQQPDVSRQFVFDHAAASFVFQVVDAKTDQVVTQFPDEAVLRVRAYFHALDRKAELGRPLPIDVSA